MSKLFTAMNASGTTLNGAETYLSTMEAVLDFFSLAGASRGKDISAEFRKALASDPELTIRALLHLRDIRQGSGERDQYRTLVKELIAWGVDAKVMSNIIKLTPEIGRFDDLEAFVGTPFEQEALTLWVSYIREGHGLACKFAPRKDKKGAKPLRTIAGLNEADWRKLVVAGSDTVEQKMCAGQWDEIEFGKLPSLAQARYSKAFNKNAHDKYQAYILSLVKGEATVNAGALYPYDVIKTLRMGGQVGIANAQWDALPNLLEGCTDRIIPVVDVSGSMQSPVGGNNNLSCKDVAISLGMYIAERNEGIFKDEFISFSSRPNFHKIVGSNLKERYQSLDRSGEDMGTNLQGVFECLLKFAQEAGLSHEDMPEKILIVSDMEFDSLTGGHYFGSRHTNFEAIKQMYKDSGYEMPHLVFWRVDVKQTKNQPAIKEDNVSLISGFSPNLLKTALKGVNPVEVMLDTLMVDRYNVF